MGGGEELPRSSPLALSPSPAAESACSERLAIEFTLLVLVLPFRFGLTWLYIMVVRVVLRVVSLVERCKLQLVVDDNVFAKRSRKMMSM